VATSPRTACTVCIAEEVFALTETPGREHSGCVMKSIELTWMSLMSPGWYDSVVVRRSRRRAGWLVT
jgi:hypothetical protein